MCISIDEFVSEYDQPSYIYEGQANAKVKHFRIW
jgi:hypothetical protein